jgi:hypothetical protein
MVELALVENGNGAHCVCVVSDSVIEVIAFGDDMQGSGSRTEAEMQHHDMNTPEHYASNIQNLTDLWNAILAIARQSNRG